MKTTNKIKELNQAVNRFGMTFKEASVIIQNASVQFRKELDKKQSLFEVLKLNRIIK